MKKKDELVQTSLRIPEWMRVELGKLVVTTRISAQSHWHAAMTQYLQGKENGR